MSKSVLFIHDIWLTPTIWQHFQSRFSACGYSCSAPGWPHANSPVNPGFEAILEYYERHLHTLSKPPLLVGHGLGGLLVQLLLDRGLGQAGIAIAPLPPRRYLAGLLSASRWLPELLGRRDRLHMTAPRFARTMAQTLAAPEQASEYAQHVVPAPSRVFFDTALGLGKRFDFANHQRAPLLLIAGGQDRIIPAARVASLYRRHRRSSAPTSFMEFPGHSHWLIAEPGWETIADYCIEWAQNQLGPF